MTVSTFMFTRRKALRRSCVAALATCLWLSIGTASHAAPPHAVHTVIIEGMQYSQPTLEVNVGETVVWKNKDPFPHTVTAENNGFHSPDLAPEQSWKFVAKKRGTYPYFCALHRTMKATLVVK